jgi:hypothetical protein
MKLISRKTRKAIEKSVRKALKKAGPALVAAIVSSVGSAVATLATTESPEKPGESNLKAMTDRAKKTVVEPGGKKARKRQARRDSVSNGADETEGSRQASTGLEAQAQLT